MILNCYRNHYAKIQISASEPIVPFRETIIEPPKMDMANEEIALQNVDKTIKEEDPIVIIHTNNKQSTIQIRAKPLPIEITNLLEKSTDLLKVISQHIKVLQRISKQNEDVENKLNNICINNGTHPTHNLSDKMLKLIDSFKEELQGICSKLSPEWKDFAQQIWSVGPRNCGANVLLNQTPDYDTKFLNLDKEIKQDPRNEYESSFVNGFQLVTVAGPLCEEPMMGVAFCVEEWSLDKSENEDSNTHTFGPLSGNYFSTISRVKLVWDVTRKKVLA